MKPKVLIGYFGSSDISKAHRTSAVLMKIDLRFSISANARRVVWNLDVPISEMLSWTDAPSEAPIEEFEVVLQAALRVQPARRVESLTIGEDFWIPAYGPSARKCEATEVMN